MQASCNGRRGLDLTRLVPVGSWTNISCTEIKVPEVAPGVGVIGVSAFCVSDLWLGQIDTNYAPSQSSS